MLLGLIIAIVVILVLLGAVAGVLGARARRRRALEEPAGAPGPAASPTATPEAVAAPPAPAEAPVAAPPQEAAATAAPAAPVEAVAPAAPLAAPPSLRERLGRTRGLFASLRAVRSKAALEAATWDELEEALLRADVGVATTDALLADLRRRVQAKEVAGGEQLIDALRADLIDLLSVEDRWDAATDATVASRDGDRPRPDDELVEPVTRELRFDDDPSAVTVWLFVGVNGVGKTTTIGKLARQQATGGRSVLLAAGDTFRAAAGEQLETWAERANVEIVRGAEGGDPSAIVFDAVQRAAARGNDLVLADTAGRLHTKVNLVEELKKIRRVADRDPGSVTEVLLVLDATTGQNGLVQAKEFTDAVAVTGVVLTKLDGTAKGGVVIPVQRDLGLPVKLVGLGEGPDDLVPFDPEQFVDALLS